MEEELDQVESGEKERVQVIQDFYIPFDDALKKAEEKREEIKESLQEERQVCGVYGISGLQIHETVGSP